MIARSGWLLLGLGSLLLGGQVRAAATIEIKVTDEAGVGFNDTTPAQPVGGNPGKTVGEQRLIVFQTAAEAWGRLLESPVPIVVEARFADLTCTNGATLAGHAGALTVSKHPELPTTGKYPLALANRIVGRDLFPSQPDIRAEFNSGLKACMGIEWYYGLDGKEAANDSNLLSVVLHELTHGLGFADGVDPDNGAFTGSSEPPPFAEHVLDNTNAKHWTEMTDDERKASLAHVRNLVWDGKRVEAVAARLLAKGSPVVQVSPALDGFSGIVGEANYGRALGDGASITGSLLTVTLPACSYSESTFAGVSGKIVLLFPPRSCSVLALAYQAEKKGALAVLASYGVVGSPPPQALDGTKEMKAKYPIVIPTLALTSDDANLLKGAAASTSVTLSANGDHLVGADQAGKTMIFASSPIQSGSTGAHWDPLVRPDLTLEPTETQTPHNSLEMERALLWDIGWTATCGNGSLDDQEECDDGADNSDLIPNACRLDCKKPRCGDGTVDKGEECDPGPIGISKKVDANCKPDCARSGAGGSGGNSASGGSSGGGAGGQAGSGGSSSKSSSSAEGGASSKGGSGGGSSAEGGSRGGGSSAEGGNGGGSSDQGGSRGGSSDQGGSSGSYSSSDSRGGGSKGGCSCRLTPASSRMGLAVPMVGLALWLGRRRRPRA